MDTDDNFSLSEEPTPKQVNRNLNSFKRAPVKQSFNSQAAHPPASENTLEQGPKRIPNSDEKASLPKEPLHFTYLRSEFRKTFGLPLGAGTKRAISSFDGVVLATGYSKAVITWQGCFFD